MVSRRPWRSDTCWPPGCCHECGIVPMRSRGSIAAHWQPCEFALDGCSQTARRRSAGRPCRPRRAAAPPCGRLFLTLSMPCATSSGLLTGSCAASTMTSPAFMPFCAAGLSGSTSSTSDARRPWRRCRTSCGTLVRQRRQLQADDRRQPWYRPRSPRLCRACLACRPPRLPAAADRDLHRLLLALAQHLHIDGSCRSASAPRSRGRPRMRRHVLAVELQDDVAGLDARPWRPGRPASRRQRARRCSPARRAFRRCLRSPSGS